MSQLEATAAPIVGPLVQGERASLDRTALHVVATWVAKTYLVLAAAAPSAQVQSLSKLRHALYQSKVPSGRQQIFIGAYRNDLVQTLCHFQPLMLEASTDKGRQAVDGHLATVAIGRLAAQVWYLDLEGATVEVGGAAPKMSRVWPYAMDLEWPAAESLTLGELQALAETDLPIAPNELLPYKHVPWGSARNQ
jgi:hypothetical protein